MSAAADLLPSKEDVTVRLLTIFKQLISEGVLVSGNRLPAERELSETFQVSRSSLRQALKVLETMGVISQRVGDGTYLNPAAASILGEPLEFLILLNGISLREIMEARIIVEPELAFRAAERVTDEDLAALQAEMESMRKYDDNAELIARHDIGFHEAIFQAAGNRLCTMMFTVVHQSLRRLIETTSQLVTLDHTLQLHQRIFQALRRRDPVEARERMTEHLMDARALLLKAHDQQQSSRLHNRINEIAAQPQASSRTGRSARKHPAPFI